MVTRRAFLASAAVAWPRLRTTALEIARAAATIDDDDRYWSAIQRAFDLDRSVIYLNSAGLSPSPRPVFDAAARDTRFTNTAPVEHLWRDLEPRVEAARAALAAEFGCDTEEIAITRNASESMETLIFGLPLRAGDEVIVSTQNYDRMLTAWDQRVRRDGIVLRVVDLPLPPPDDGAIVDAIKAAVSPRTRVIELPQLTNWTGQPIPIAAIVALARPLGIDVLVDGAQSFAQIPTTRDALGCDYFGASLHKWLYAPLGTGMLYVRRDRIPALWPLFGAPATMRDDIRKFEQIGTHPAAPHNAITTALAFHHAIGGPRKLARLRLLRDRWTRPVLADDPRVRIRTPLDDPRSGAIVLLEIDGLDPVALHDWLWTRYHVITSPTNFGGVAGLRITPNVFTTFTELDTLTDALRRAIRRGLH
jgi:selenocysteine lyase/cysteine desulfurase